MFLLRVLLELVLKLQTERSRLSAKSGVGIAYKPGTCLQVIISFKMQFLFEEIRGCRVNEKRKAVYIKWLHPNSSRSEMRRLSNVEMWRGQMTKTIRIAAVNKHNSLGC